MAMHVRQERASRTDYRLPLQTCGDGKATRAHGVEKDGCKHNTCLPASVPGRLNGDPIKANHLQTLCRADSDPSCLDWNTC